MLALPVLALRPNDLNLPMLRYDLQVQGWGPLRATTHARRQATARKQQKSGVSPTSQCRAGRTHIQTAREQIRSRDSKVATARSRYIRGGGFYKVDILRAAFTLHRSQKNTLHRQGSYPAIASACSRDCTRAAQSTTIPLSQQQQHLDPFAHGIWDDDE